MLCSVSYTTTCTCKSISAHLVATASGRPFNAFSGTASRSSRNFSRRPLDSPRVFALQNSKHTVPSLSYLALNVEISSSPPKSPYKVSLDIVRKTISTYVSLGLQNKTPRIVDYQEARPSFQPLSERSLCHAQISPSSIYAHQYRFRPGVCVWR